MLQRPSNKVVAGIRRAILAVSVACALAACAKTGTTAPSSQTTGRGTVGYVRMDELVKHHPLYSQLAQYNDSIAALNLSATVPQVAKPDAAIAKQEAALQAQLNAAADRTRKLIDEKSKEYQQRESQAIAQALRSNANAPSAGAIQQQIQTTARGQAAGVSAQAQRDLQSYRKTLDAQDGAELAAAQKTLTDRATRTFRAKQDELAAKESALTLDLASKDAAERLSLRTRLSSLAMEDADREDARSKLAAIDRREADALAPVKNRDQQTLVTLQAQLREQVQRDMQNRANQIHSRAVAKLRAREDDLRRQFSSGPLIATRVQNGKSTQQINPNLPPDLRARIQTLHNDYQRQFTDDAKATITDFNKTRDDLRRRYEQLRGIDGAAQNGAQAQIASLTKKRDDLYGQMVAQIGREVRLIAQQRGIAVVVTDPVANAAGVDLTSDAMKDIESLHE
ncbi:MAG: hypothetical protein ABR591_07960 [Candidatus Velthaea sp.]